MTETLTMTGKSVTRLQFVVPTMVGLLSVLAVFNATSHSESPYVFVGIHAFWLGLGAVALTATFLPMNEHVRWAPVTGCVGLALLYATIFVPGISVVGRPGTIQPWGFQHASIQPAVLLAPVYVLWTVRYLPIQKHGGDVSWKRFLIYLGQCMVWWLPLMVIPEKAMLVAAVLTFVGIYWIEGGDGRKAISAIASAAGMLTIMLCSFKWLPGRYLSQRSSDQWVVSMTLGEVSFFETTNATARAQETLPTGNDTAVFLGLLESVGYVGVAFLLVVAGLVGWFAVRRALRAESPVSTAVTVGAWIWLCTRALTFAVTILGITPRMTVPCPVFNANGNDLMAVMMILSMGLYRSGLRLPSGETSTTGG